MSKKLKIDWVNRSHFFTQGEMSYLYNFLKTSTSLTQGNELLKFETSLKKYLKIQNINVVSSAAAGLEIIALLLNYIRYFKI